MFFYNAVDTHAVYSGRGPTSVRFKPLRLQWGLQKCEEDEDCASWNCSFLPIYVDRRCIL